MFLHMIPVSTTHILTLKSRNFLFILKSPIPSSRRPGQKRVPSAWTVDHAEKKRSPLVATAQTVETLGKSCTLLFWGDLFCLFIFKICVYLGCTRSSVLLEFSDQGIEPGPPTLGALSLSHWTT